MTVTTNIKLNKKLVSQAIEVLRSSNQNEQSEKKALFEDDSSTLYLQVLLKKIPKRNGAQMIKVNLPHSLLKDTDEVCLITGDTNKTDKKAETEPDVLHYKALLDKHGITQVSKIVTLRQLRTDYKPYADKQKLLAAYDVFLADNKIYECLPRLLGKFFYKKRKFPLKINMNTPYLKQQIEKALSVKMFYVTGNGNSCCSEVATLDMSDSEVLANVMEMINVVSKEMPGASENIMGIYLKTARSKSIPMYVSFDNPNDVILPEEKDDDDVVIDDLTTKPNVSVKVHKDGRLELFTAKKNQQASFEEITTEDNDKEIECNSPEKNKKGSKKSELKGDVVIKDMPHGDSTKKSKKGKKNVFEESNITPLMTGDVVIKGMPQGDSTKKSKKGKMNVSEDSNETPLMTEDLQKKKDKLTFKRKRDQSESGSVEKKPFLSFESPKQIMKKRKVDPENLSKQQLSKNARKKMLQQKSKKSLKA